MDAIRVKDGPVLSQRKKFRKQAERIYCGIQLGWRGGQMYFLTGVNKGTPVPGVEKVPRPGKEAVGLSGAEPEPLGGSRQVTFDHSPRLYTYDYISRWST
jgi:hypothetical protein